MNAPANIPKCKAGWKYFPLHPGTKEPIHKGWPQIATENPDTIADWSREYPKCNWGCAMGPSGLAAIDVDGSTGEVSFLDFELERGALPPTLEHGTPRGGRHLIFSDPDRTLGNTQNKLGSKIDTRGRHGFIVVPPSTFDGKPYKCIADRQPAPIPKFVVDAARVEHEAREAPEGFIPNLPVNRGRLVEALGNAAPAVQGSGGEAQTLAIGYAAYDLGASEDVALPLIVEIYNPRCIDPWDRDELAAKIHNAYLYPQNAFGCRAVLPWTAIFPPDALENLLLNAPTRTEDNPADKEKRVIKVVGGNLPQNVDEAEAALIESSANLYQRGELLVRPGDVVVGVRGGKKAKDLLLVPVRQPEVIERMTDAAQFQRWDARMEDWKTINCPKEVADTYLSRTGRWKLRPLMGIINAPTLRHDGSLLDKPGYDASTALLYDPRGATFPAIPLHPTKDEAAAALKIIEAELLCGFPFATPEAKAVAVAAILTGCIRRTLPTAPLFGFDATGAGSGKSLAADTVATVGCGRPASPITIGGKAEEFEKRLASILIRGDGALCIDNVNVPLDGDFLCSVLTQESASCRILGTSRAPRTPTNCLFMATGNGLTFGGDTWRRGLISLIDPAMERPGDRVFDFNPVDRAKEMRGRYVAAALTVLRAYQVAGMPEQGGRPMGSFEVWCRTARDALLWLGEADPVATCAPPTDDPERERFGAVLLAWREVISDGHGVTLKEAIRAAIDAATATPSRPQLFDAFHAVAAPMVRGEEKLDGRRLAIWLRGKKRQVIHGLRLMPEGVSEGVARWRLESVDKKGRKI